MSSVVLTHDALSTARTTTPAVVLDRPPSGRHYAALDGLRGIAILPVIAQHLASQSFDHASGADKTFITICQSGWVGVELFFVLSGFLITGILMDSRSSERYFRSFFGRRILRIFPAYYAVLAAYFILLPAFARFLSADLQGSIADMSRQQLWFWCYIPNVLFASQGGFENCPGGYFWSLAVEEQFYLVWPFLILFCPPHRLTYAFAVLFVVSTGLRLSLLYGGYTPTTAYVLPVTHLDGLLAGAFIAVLWRQRGRIAEYVSMFRGMAYCGGAVLVTGTVYNGRFHFWDPWVTAVGYSLLAACFGYLLIIALRAAPESWTFRILTNGVLRSFGRYSYAIYLVHLPLGILLERIVFSPRDYRIGGSMIPAMVAFILVGTIASWLAGFLSWHMFEKHFIRLKKLFPYEPAKRAALV